MKDIEYCREKFENPIVIFQTIQDRDGNDITLYFEVCYDTKRMQLAYASTEETKIIIFHHRKELHIDDKLKKINITRTMYDKACLAVKLKMSRECMKIRNEFEYFMYLQSFLKQKKD